MSKLTGLNATIDCNMNERLNDNIRFIGFEPEVDLTLSTILLIVGTVAVFGNLLVLYYFFVTTKQEKNLLKPLFVNLAIVDCMMGILTLAYGKYLDIGRFKLACMVSDPYQWGWEMMQISGALFDNTPKAVVNIFAAISVFRLLAVIKPFVYRDLKMRKRFIIPLIIGICYGIPLVFCLLPLFAHMNHGTKLRYSYNSLYGFPGFDQKYLKPGTEDLIFKVFYIMVPYFVPALTILVSSAILFKRITKRNSGPNQQTGPTKTMLIMAVYIFICKIPLMVMIVYDMLQTLELITTYKTGTPLISFQDFYIFFPTNWTIMCISSALSPAIYFVRSRQLFEKPEKDSTTRRLQQNSTKISRV